MRDETVATFEVAVERHRRELLVHCYRMVGSLQEAEDLVQETFLRAWSNLDGFAARSSLRAWLYRIATNACLDVLAVRGRRALPHQIGAAAGPEDAFAPPRADVPWLGPFPDRLWEPPAPSAERPDVEAVARETIELAFLAAIQHLPARQRAAFILRDVAGWRATEAAEMLGASVVSVNSALQRARATMREHLPRGRGDWAAARPPSAAERAVLDRYMEAVERADLRAVAELLAEEVRAAMPPYPAWFAGRSAVLGSLAASWDPALPAYVGRFRVARVAANGQLGMASWVRTDDTGPYRAFAISVLGFEDDRIAEMTAFHDEALFAAFGLPLTHR